MLRNVRVHHNRILNADYAFTFEAVQAEGRLHDWYFGHPRHDMHWADFVADDVITCQFTDNRIENLTVQDNSVYGYRYRVQASGANLRGHAIASRNTVTEGVVFDRNTFVNFI